MMTELDQEVLVAQIKDYREKLMYCKLMRKDLFGKINALEKKIAMYEDKIYRLANLPLKIDGDK